RLVATFGLASLLSGRGGPTLTRGQRVGSPAYMSAEQLMGSRAVDARTDIYSLGGVLHEMLVGEPPLVGIARRTSRGGAALDTVLRAQRVSQRSERLIRQTIGRALAAEPDDRFASVDEFTASLRAVVRRG